MTVSTTTTTVSYTGDGTTVAFAVPFSFDSSSDLTVTQRVTATGVETTKALTTDYAVSGGSGSTGTVTAVTAPASTVTWTIRRATTRTQATDYRENDPFPADTHETTVDKLTRITQEIGNTLETRALLLPATESGNNTFSSNVSRASSYPYFDANGTLTTIAGTANAPVSSAMAPVVVAASTAAALSALGAPADAIVLKQGKQTIYFPAGALTAPASNAPSTGNLTAGNITLATKDFDAATRESLWGAFQAPKSYDLSTLTVQALWGHANTSGNFGVTWGFRAVALTDGENIANQAMGTQVNVSDTGGTQNFTYRSADSGNITVGSNVSARDLIVFELSREPAEANDTMAVDAKLVGLTLLMNVSAANDT